MHATPTARRGIRFPGDENLHVLFYVDAVESELKSKAVGHAIFDDYEMIEIRVPGDDKTIIKTIVTDEHRYRFPDEYSSFRQNNDVTQVSGTPLEAWAHLTPSLIATLKAQNVRTVEQLASIADSNANFMGAHELRSKAKAFLKVAEDASAVDRQEKQLAEQKATNDALLARITELEAAAKKK